MEKQRRSTTRSRRSSIKDAAEPSNVAPPPLFSAVAPSATPPELAYQLKIINTCIANDDIRLPRHPTPALLSSFYSSWADLEASGAFGSGGNGQHSTLPCAGATSGAAEGNRFKQVHQRWRGRGRGRGNAASGPSTAPSEWSPWYWMRQVPHVAMGRHSLLPPRYQLHHHCISRLHARIIYVSTASLHGTLLRGFTPVKRRPSPTQEQSQDWTANEEVAVEVVSQSDDEVVIVGTSSPLPLCPDGPAAPLLAFTDPYYLLINCSENPVFVTRTVIPPQHSVVLEEGDVVSFLECAFDSDGGVLDTVTACGSKEEAEPVLPREETDETVRQPSSTEPEIVDRIVSSAFVATSARQQNGGHDGSEAASQPFILAGDRTVAKRRPYQPSGRLLEYIRWYQLHMESSAATAARQVEGHAPDGGFAVGLQKTRHHCPKETSSSHKKELASTARNKAANTREGGLDETLENPERLPALHASVVKEELNEELATATAAARLAALLEDEMLESVAGEVVSPLAPQLVLDTRYIRRILRQWRQRNGGGLGRRTTPTSPIKDENDNDGEVDQEITEKNDMDSWCAIAESFRVPPPGAEEVAAVTTNEEQCGNITVASCPRPNLVQSTLAELQKIGGPTATGATSVGAVPVALQKLQLDDEISEDGSGVMMPSATLRARNVDPPIAAPAEQSIATSMAGIRVRPAALPVYLFLRRSPSPEVHTKESSVLAHDGVHMGLVSGRRGQASPQYVFYYDETGGEASSPALPTPLATTTASSSSVTAYGRGHGAVMVRAKEEEQPVWVDETEPSRPSAVGSRRRVRALSRQSSRRRRGPARRAR